MKPRPITPGALPVPAIYQQLLAFLLEHHYGLSLNDTPYHDEQVIAQQVEREISVGDTVNTLVEQYALVRIGRTGFSSLAQDPALARPQGCGVCIFCLPCSTQPSPSTLFNHRDNLHG